MAKRHVIQKKLQQCQNTCILMVKFKLGTEVKKHIPLPFIFDYATKLFFYFKLYQEIQLTKMNNIVLRNEVKSCK